jgi:chromosome segregation ATPase
MPSSKMRNQKSNLKNSAVTIKSCCSFDFVIENYIEIREKYDALKNEYEKLKVIEEQKIQLKRDYDEKLNIIGSRNNSIQNLNAKIKKMEKGYEKDMKQFHNDMEKEMKKSCKLEKELEYMKSNTVSKDDYERRDSYAKKRDEIIIEQNKKIEELSEQVNSTKINSVEILKNTIRLQKEQIIYLKEGYGKFDLEEDEKLQKEIETLKEEKEVFIKTIQKFKEYSALMFDLETPLVDD